MSELDVFFLKLKKEGISKKEQEILYDLVTNLENRTEIQKNRFLLYYNLDPNQHEEYNFTNLAKHCGCTCTAVRVSISRIRNGLVNSNENERESFFRLVKNNI